MPWYVLVPYQFLLISPVLAPVWVIGWWRLLRRPELRVWRSFAVAYLLLLLLFVVTGGKPYYLGGMYPVLLAAGAQPVADWGLAAGRTLRRGLLAVALAVSLAVSAFLFLPIVPVTALGNTPVLAINSDAGATVGWPAFAAAVRRVRSQLPPGERVVVLTENYGEAGAIDRYAPELAPAYSGHNSFWSWGPPPDSARTTIAVGFSARTLHRWFGSVQLVTHFDDGVGVDNDEQGVPIWVVRDPVHSWHDIWPALRTLG